MNRRQMSTFFVLVFTLGGTAWAQDDSTLRHDQEKHLRNIRQLTFGGQNAEAYFSADGHRLIFQSTRDDFECDQIYTMTTQGDSVAMVSTGKGRTTCAFLGHRRAVTALLIHAPGV